ncbi:MAG: hypothetical protein OXR62_06445 [Ahrensia sp.]|nr:hypothetical protein [Ahrensia sp.]
MFRLSNLILATSMLAASLVLTGCNSSGSSNAEVRKEIERLNATRTRLSPGGR